jgi:hypothetical protein
MARRQSVQKPTRPVRLKICVTAECGEQAVSRYFEEPDRVRPAIRAAIRRALPIVGVVDPHSAVAP